jgi:D-lactate dehydrogenase
MRVLVFSARPYDVEYLQQANAGQHELSFTADALSAESARLAQGYEAVCCFVDDHAPANVIAQLAEGGTRLLTLRSTGFNNVDLLAAEKNGITVARVSRYSPYSVAEFAVALLLTLNRKTYRAFNRTREYNFLLEGLLGFDLHGKTVGVVGTGKIGEVLCGIMQGFGCRMLAYDVQQNPACLKMGVEYLPLDELLPQCDIISLHVPLLPETRHLINAETLGKLKRGATLINTSRGGLIDTPALVAALRSGQVGAAGLDVYEEEEGLYYQDLSATPTRDDVLSTLLAFPNVIVTGHQAFFTHEALSTITATTIANISDFEDGRTSENVLRAK